MYINSYQTEQNARTWRQEQQTKATQDRMLPSRQHNQERAITRFSLQSGRSIVAAIILAMTLGHGFVVVQTEGAQAEHSQSEVAAAPAKLRGYSSLA